MSWAVVRACCIKLGNRCLLPVVSNPYSTLPWRNFTCFQFCSPADVVCTDTQYCIEFDSERKKLTHWELWCLCHTITTNVERRVTQLPRHPRSGSTSGRSDALWHVTTLRLVPQTRKLSPTGLHMRKKNVSPSIGRKRMNAAGGAPTNPNCSAATLCRRLAMGHSFRQTWYYFAVVATATHPTARTHV